MSLEFNKATSAVLIAGLTAMIVGKVADAAYKPELEVKNPGYEIVVANVEVSAAEATGQEEVVDVAALMASADAAKGEKNFKKCKACHTVENGAPHRVGPNLWGVYGSPKGGKAGFSYSDAMKSKGGNWDEEALYAFMKKPKAYVKGTKMSFAGFRKDQQAADMVAYLKTLK
jgi:cytochrome c